MTPKPDPSYAHIEQQQQHAVENFIYIYAMREENKKILKTITGR
jgi:hypothetical protein